MSDGPVNSADPSGLDDQASASSGDPKDPTYTLDGGIADAPAPTPDTAPEASTPAAGAAAGPPAGTPSDSAPGTPLPAPAAGPATSAPPAPAASPAAAAPPPAPTSPAPPSAPAPQPADTGFFMQQAQAADMEAKRADSLAGTVGWYAAEAAVGPVAIAEDIISGLGNAATYYLARPASPTRTSTS